MSRTAGGVTTSFLYDGDAVLLEQQGGATTASYSYGNALTRKDGETPLFDGLGSERTVTNAGGAVQATLTLTAFGQSIASSGSSTDPYQYAATSRYRSDGDAGLALVGCRYYDAQVGQFITRDTYLDQKPYAYCDADPVNALDPSGHSSEIWGAIRFCKPATQIACRFSAGSNVVAILGGMSYINGDDPGTLSNDLAAVGGGYSLVSGIGSIIGGLAIAGGTTTAAAVFGGIAVATGVGAVAVGIAVIVVAVGRNSGTL